MSEPTPSGPSARRAIGLVTRKEIRSRITSRAFLVVTIILTIAPVGLILALKFLSGGESTSTVGFTQTSTELADPLVAAGQSVGEKITTSTVPDQDTGERQVRDGDLDALVVGLPDQVHVIVHKDIKENLNNAFGVLARQRAVDNEIAKVGGDPESADRAIATARPDITRQEPPSGTETQRLVFGSVTSVLIYIGLLLYGQGVARGVVEEKANRIVELLLTGIRSWQLMLGKVIGAGVVGFAQLLVTGIVGVGAGLATGVLSVSSSAVIGAAAWGLLWFVLGFIIFALIFAAAGSLVSRQEDADSAIGPPMMLLIVPFVLGQSILPADPDNAFMRVLSLIPLFSPTLMPIRIAIGVPFWEIALSVALTVGLLALMIVLTGRVFRNAILRTGTKIKFRDALRAG